MHLIYFDLAGIILVVDNPPDRKKMIVLAHIPASKVPRLMVPSSTEFPVGRSASLQDFKIALLITTVAHSLASSSPTRSSTMWHSINLFANSTIC
jgi:hypothetical protein